MSTILQLKKREEKENNKTKKIPQNLFGGSSWLLGTFQPP